MKHILIISSLILSLSACSFIDEDRIQKTSDISIDTFLHSWSTSYKTQPITNTWSTTTNTSPVLVNTGTVSPSSLPVKPPLPKGEKTKVKTLIPATSTGTTDTNTDPSDKEVEGLINSLFSDLN